MADLCPAIIIVQRKQPKVYLLDGSTMHHVNITSNLDRYITSVGVCVYKWHVQHKHITHSQVI